MASAILYPRSAQIAGGISLKCNGSEYKHKRGRKKTVRWPIDEKISEVRHFLVDDAPSFLGVAMFAHTVGSHNLNRIYPHEAKRARFTSVVEPGEDLADVPPGFGHHIAKKPVLEALMDIDVPWHCPDKFNLDGSWLWARGEESKEVALQHQREMRVFEAVYPRLASVPDSPAESEGGCKVIATTLISEIPLIPVEEEVDSKDVEPEKKIIERECTVIPLPPEDREIAAGVPIPSNGILHSNAMAESVKYRQIDSMSKADSNVAAVAAAACMAVKALEENDLVDETLLLAILKNPSLLNSLTSHQVTKDKRQDQNSDAAARWVSREPVASSSGKLPTEHAAYLNASPDSVLAKWGDGGSNGSPFGFTSITSGNTNMWQSGNTNPTSINLNPPVATSLSYDPVTTIYTERKWMHEGDEIAPTRHTQIPDLSKNIPFNPSHLQEPSLVHVYRPKDETKLIPSVSSQNGASIDSWQPVRTVANIDNRQPVWTVATPGPLVSTLSVQTFTTNSYSMHREGPQEILSRVDPSLRRLVQNADLNSVQTKRTALCVSGGRAKRFCMYFNSSRGCRNGGSCPFMHQSLDSELNATMQ